MAPLNIKPYCKTCETYFNEYSRKKWECYLVEATKGPDDEPCVCKDCLIKSMCRNSCDDFFEQRFP